jgi:hypothetical protein
MLTYRKHHNLMTFGLSCHKTASLNYGNFTKVVRATHYDDDS